jgi:DNA primase
VPLQQVLERICGVPIKTVQHRGPCPIHEPNTTSGRKFSANLKRQVFRCFDSSCAVQGNVLDLWKAHKKLDLYEAAEDLAKTFGVTLPYLSSGTQKHTENKDKKSRGHHPPGS